MSARPPAARSWRGSWERDPSHWPLPLTPAFRSFYWPWQAAAFAAMFAESGFIARGVRWRDLDGYGYFQGVPVGGWTPPRRLTPLLARGWRLHPALRSRVHRAARQADGRHDRALLARWEGEWKLRVAAELAEALATDLAALDERALATHLRRVCARAAAYVTIHFLLHGAIAPAVARLDRLCRATPALAAIAATDLLMGLSAASSRPGWALADLATMLRARPALRERLEQAGDVAVEQLEQIDAEFGGAFRSWIGEFGHRVTARYEFVAPTLAEQPERVLRLARDLAARPAEPNREQAVHVRRETLVAEARARLGAGPARAEFEEALAAAQRAYPVRDGNTVLTFGANFAVVRYALLEVGRRWAGSVLDQADDVFFLTGSEIMAGIERGRPAAADSIGLHARARRRTWEAAVSAPPPPVFIGPPAYDPPLAAFPSAVADRYRGLLWYLRTVQALAGSEPEPAASPLAPTERVELRGLGAVRGRYQGRARVVLDESQFERVEAGDVLVCPITSPAWSLLFPLLGALVTDHGGVLSHPAVIAREYGLPAVVATGDATRRIPDGARVTVDGDAGTVMVEGEIG